METHIYKSDKGDIEYLFEGSGPIVLISHGVTGGVDQCKGLSERYLGLGYRCLYVSRFGYLNSSFPDNASARLQAKAYSDMLDYLGIGSVYIFGNSAGSTSALHFAIDSPEKCQGLILVSPNVPGNKKALPPRLFMSLIFGIDFLYWPVIKLFGRYMLQMFVPVAVERALTKIQRGELIDEVFMASYPITRRTKGVLFDTYVSNPSINEGMAYDKIKSPALIIHAVDDPAPPIEGARILSKKIMNSKFVPFQTGGHLILNHENEIKDSIREFICRKT